MPNLRRSYSTTSNPRNIGAPTSQIELIILRRIELMKFSGEPTEDEKAQFDEEITYLADIADLGHVGTVLKNPGDQPRFAKIRARITIIRAVRANAKLKMPILAPKQAKEWCEACDIDYEEALRPETVESGRAISGLLGKAGVILLVSLVSLQLYVMLHQIENKRTERNTTE